MKITIEYEGECNLETTTESFAHAAGGTKVDMSKFQYKEYNLKLPKLFSAKVIIHEDELHKGQTLNNVKVSIDNKIDDDRFKNALYHVVVKELSSDNSNTRK